jgi:hypothetical protein
MAILEIAKIQVRRGEENVTGIPQLDPGEFGWAQDTEHLYIGKRISEGAKDDNNTRILTENDQATIIDNLGTTLRSFLSTSTVASTATYKYRVSDAHIHSNTSSISIKLDNAVSLTDYLPVGLPEDEHYKEPYGFYWPRKKDLEELILTHPNFSIRDLNLEKICCTYIHHDFQKTNKSSLRE